MNTTCTPSSKQMRYITALQWQLRPYYRYDQWHKIEVMLDRLLATATMEICCRVIQRMISALAEKQAQHATIYWIRESYSLGDSNWRNQLLKMAMFLFSETEEPENVDGWRELKNRIEREELRRSYELVPDEFEDTRFAEEEEERWQQSKRPYSEIIDGLDFLAPTPGIDYP